MKGQNMIELVVDEFSGGEVVFHISRQDKEDYNKLYKKRSFICDGKKISLRSIGYPDIRFVSEDELTFLVRGGCKRYDEKKITVELQEYLVLYRAVLDYNKSN